MKRCGKEKAGRLPEIRHVVGYLIIIFVIFLTHAAGADNGRECPFKGTFKGEYNGDVMGQAVRGTFTINISADGTVTGSFIGYDQGAISGTVSESGNINAKGSAGIARWTGKLSITDGRLSGKGSWEGFNGGGLWWSE